MENNKTIKLVTDNGEKDADIITVINIEGMGDYVIYKVDDLMYGAKYELDKDGTKLDADLTDLEKEALNKAFEKWVSENA